MLNCSFNNFGNINNLPCRHKSMQNFIFFALGIFMSKSMYPMYPSLMLLLGLRIL